jgi:hypothetical protein
MRRTKELRKIQDITFNEYTRNLIFQELHDRFGFPVKVWKKKFNEELSRRPTHVSEEDYFPYFGNTHINPILNDILGRNRLHPTFNKFMEYLLQAE